MGAEPRQLDLDALGKQYDVRVALSRAEDPTERAARLERESDDAKHSRALAVMRFCLVAFALYSLAGVCVWIVLAERSSAEARTWAMTVLGSIVTGSVSYVIGERTGASRRG